jgi:hypothetical protein
MASGPVAVDYGQAQAVAAQQKQGFSDLLNQQDAKAQGLFNQYTATSQAQPKLVDVLTKAQQDAGIGDLQNNINLFNSQASGVKTLIDRLNENTGARTMGTNANQAYLDRLRAVEGGSLNTQLSRLTTGLGDVTNAFNTSNANTGQLLSATQADQQTALHPLELQINALSDQFARQITGFTTSSQNELNTLLTKLQNQQTLNNQEWERANALADQERQFQQARTLAAQQSASTNAFLGSGLTGKSSGVGSAAAKQGGGFNFTDANGKATSAASFAAANGVGIGDLLYRMGQGGDKYAQQAYNQIKANQSYYNAHPDVLKSEFSSLFWGA